MLHALMARAPRYCCRSNGSEDLLYILYTSGTTGKPKGIMHTTGGYLTGTYATSKWVFDLKDEDVYWCTADIGWVTGHSYVVYGPLANGATVVMYEGAPDWPQKDRLWEIVERYGVTVFYTAPTAIRAFMKWERLAEASNSPAYRLWLGGSPSTPSVDLVPKKLGGGLRLSTRVAYRNGNDMITPYPASPAEPDRRPFRSPHQGEIRTQQVR